MYNLSRDILKPSYITKMHALLFQLNVFGLLGRQGILNKSYKIEMIATKKINPTSIHSIKLNRSFGALL